MVRMREPGFCLSSAPPSAFNPNSGFDPGITLMLRWHCAGQQIPVDRVSERLRRTPFEINSDSLRAVPAAVMLRTHGTADPVAGFVVASLAWTLGRASCTCSAMKLPRFDERRQR